MSIPVRLAMATLVNGVIAIGASAGDWPMFRGDPAQHGVASCALPAKPEVLWTFQAGESVSCTAAIAGGDVYIGDDEGFFYCLDLMTGKQKWKHEIPDNMPIQSGPLVLGESVYFGDDNGVLHALDAKTGSQRWTLQTDGQIISAINHYKDRLLFGSYDGFVYCVSAVDGQVTWKYETQGRVHGTPGVAGDFVLAAGCDEGLHVINIADGKQVRETRLGSVSGSSATIDGSYAYVGLYASAVACIDWQSGDVKWAQQNADRDFPILSSTAVAGGKVFVGGRDKRLRGIDAATGELTWEFVTKGRIDSSPVVVGDRVFFGCNDGVLYAVQAADGAEAWRYEIGAPMTASPAVANERLVIGTHDGLIYCFGESSGAAPGN